MHWRMTRTSKWYLQAHLQFTDCIVTLVVHSTASTGSDSSGRGNCAARRSHPADSQVHQRTCQHLQGLVSAGNRARNYIGSHRLQSRADRAQCGEGHQRAGQGNVFFFVLLMVSRPLSTRRSTAPNCACFCCALAF